MQETWVWCLGRKDPLEEEMATHSTIFAWRIPWVEEPGGLQSMGSQRVWVSDWAYTHMWCLTAINLIYIYIYFFFFFISDVVFLTSSNLTWYFLQFIFLFCSLLEHIKYIFNSCFNVLSTDYVISASASLFSSYWYWDNIFYCLIVWQFMIRHQCCQLCAIGCSNFFFFFGCSNF